MHGKITGLLMAFLSSSLAIGQNAQFQNVFQFNVGKGPTYDLGTYAIGSDEFVATENRVYVGSFDKALFNWLSLGMSASAQDINLNADQMPETVLDGVSPTNLAYDLKRIHVGSKLLVHFYTKKNWDLYTGIRPAATFWMSQWESDNIAAQEGTKPPYFTRSNTHIGLIPVGARAYLTKRLGASVETNYTFGDGDERNKNPFTVSVGVAYRFGGDSKEVARETGNGMYPTCRKGFSRVMR